MLIRRLVPSDASVFQKLRLAALRDCPSAFSSSYEEECETPLATIATNLGQRNLFGAFDGDELVGMVGVGRDVSPKLRHTCAIRAMYVAPTCRGKGVGRQLLEQALLFAESMEGVCQLTLVVTAGNAPAVTLYQSMGFAIYGCEPRALFADGKFYDNVLMVRLVEGR